MLVRQRVPEIMDDPQLDSDLHRQALAGLERLNAISNSKQIVARPIENLLLTAPAGNPLRVLDLACGGGDLAMALSSYFHSKKQAVQILGVDVSPLAVEYATSKWQDFCGKSGLSMPSQLQKSCSFSRLDVLGEELPAGFDVIMTSLFTHHLDPPDIQALLAKMAASAGKLVLVNDLERHPLSLWSVTLATKLVTTSKVVQHDGPASVRAAFTTTEMLQMAQAAGLKEATVERHFPCRMLLSWQRGEQR
ncbi:MAG: methyltransferase domain-containing protein [Cyanobacteria bacterium SZAS TMP-1]|nr:methyltransferase domain-containing protein [Cyanobacteria bacterium SZAS TMP-1]